MKAIILGAGQGTRLMPLTSNTPKSLLPVTDDFTILGYQLTQLAEAGIEEVIVVTGFRGEKVDEEILKYRDVIKARAVFNPSIK